MANNKRVKEIQTVLNGLGLKDCAITMTNNGHYEINSDSFTRKVFASSSPSDHRAGLKMKSEVRRAIKPELLNNLTRRMFTSEEKNIIVEEAKDKSTAELQALAEKYGCGFSSIKKWMVESDDKVGKRELYEKSREEVIRDCEENMLTPLQIALKNGVPIKTVYNWRAKEKSKSTSYIKSGKVEKTTPKEKSEAVTTNAFDLAIDTLKNASSELKALQAKISELEAQNAEYKARFDLMTEALKV